MPAEVRETSLKIVYISLDVILLAVVEIFFFFFFSQIKMELEEF